MPKYGHVTTAHHITVKLVSHGSLPGERPNDQCVTTIVLYLLLMTEKDYKDVVIGVPLECQVNETLTRVDCVCVATQHPRFFGGQSARDAPYSLDVGLNRDRISVNCTCKVMRLKVT